MSDEWSRRPYFFLSYAHTPRSAPDEGGTDRWVDLLFRDLSANVMELTTLESGARAGFMDRDMTLGSHWSMEISEALADCRVFVPLYSPRYFRSQLCGQEWYAFVRRHPQAVQAIVPALWVPMPGGLLPPIAASLQFMHADFGTEYADEGLYGLIKLRYLRDEYERAVYELAKRIVEVARSVQLPVTGPLDVLQVPSAFEQRTEEHTLTVVPVTSEPLEWSPYGGSVSLVSLAVELARGLGLVTSVQRFTDPPPAGRPVLLLIDPSTLGDPTVGDRLRRWDAEAGHRTTAIVAVSPTDREPAWDSSELGTVIPRILRQSRATSRAAVSGVGDLSSFREAFSVLARRTTPRPRLSGGEPR
ncbi:TIR-like protein FxsC [Streptomyces sp. NPDC093970]|uniref:TIR-like protein FxsC n=1 Tax=Streptomyces sp. NPDC093970 TaxID=3155076 RepID=UPI003445CBC8